MGETTTIPAIRLADPFPDAPMSGPASAHTPARLPAVRTARGR